MFFEPRPRHPAMKRLSHNPIFCEIESVYFSLIHHHSRYLFETCTIVFSEEVENKLNKYRGLIKEKDLEQLVVVKEFGIKYLIAYDRHFEGIEEYRTPREFVLAMGLEAFGSEY